MHELFLTNSFLSSLKGRGRFRDSAVPCFLIVEVASSVMRAALRSRMPRTVVSGWSVRVMVVVPVVAEHVVVRIIVVCVWW